MPTRTKRQKEDKPKIVQILESAGVEVKSLNPDDFVGKKVSFVLKPHYVKSCIFWSEGCHCNSRLLREKGNVWCGGKGNCGHYEYLQPWARHLHKLGKHIRSKREGWLEATWIKHGDKKEKE